MEDEMDTGAIMLLQGFTLQQSTIEATRNARRLQAFWFDASFGAGRIKDEGSRRTSDK